MAHPTDLKGTEKMATEIDTKAVLTSAKTALTKAQNALKSNDNDDKLAELSAEFLKAKVDVDKAERADVAANKAEFVEQVGESTDVVRAAFHSDALAESMNILRLAGIKRITVEIEGDGVYLVDTHSGQRGAQIGGTRKTEKYELEVAGAMSTFTAGQVISQFGERMANYDTRIEQISSGDLKRKEFAREIVESMKGSVVGGGD